MPVRLLTVSEYARHRGCDEKAVRKALAEGRITRAATGRHCIDPEVADIQWAKNTRARGDSGGKAHQAPARPGGQHNGQPNGQAPGAPGADDPGAAAGEDYTSMRARRERAEAMMAELELAKVSNKVLDREPALRAIYTKFRELRDNTTVLGRKLAPALAPMHDEREIRIAIDRAVAEIFDTFVRRSLQSLVDGLNGSPTVMPIELRTAPAPSDDQAGPP